MASLTNVVKVCPQDGPLQVVVDALPPDSEIHLAPGVYEGVLTIPVDKYGLRLIGQGTGPGEVVLACDHHSRGINPATGQAYGTTGSASVFWLADAGVARNLTFANTYVAIDPVDHHQAVALKTEGDRLLFERCRFVGRQDTLYVNSPTPQQIARQYFRDCEIEGDVDFIFGRARAVFERCVIRAISERVRRGFFTAPSTWEGNPLGFLFQSCRFDGLGEAAAFALGRPWSADKAPHLPRCTISNGQMVVRESWLAEVVGPWVDFDSPVLCRVDPTRLLEYANRGPGALASAGRPQLDALAASHYTVASYLRGADGWAPELADSAHP